LSSLDWYHQPQPSWPDWPRQGGACCHNVGGHPAQPSPAGAGHCDAHLHHDVVLASWQPTLCAEHRGQRRGNLSVLMMMMMTVTMLMTVVKEGEISVCWSQYHLHHFHVQMFIFIMFQIMVQQLKYHKDSSVIIPSVMMTEESWWWWWWWIWSCSPPDVWPCSPPDVWPCSPPDVWPCSPPDVDRFVGLWLTAVSSIHKHVNWYVIITIIISIIIVVKVLRAGLVPVLKYASAFDRYIDYLDEHHKQFKVSVIFSTKLQQVPDCGQFGDDILPPGFGRCIIINKMSSLLLLPPRCCMPRRPRVCTAPGELHTATGVVVYISDIYTLINL